MTNIGIGHSVLRKEASDKVTGAAQYTDDFIEVGLLHAKLATSQIAHGKILKIETSEAWRQPGVQAIITGDDIDILCGSLIKDRPPLARGKVRYFGEPVAMVVANSDFEATAAVTKIKIHYELLPVVNSIADALKKDAPLVHEYNGFYKNKEEKIHPLPSTNIMQQVKVRKGDMEQGQKEGCVAVETSFQLPQSDHIATETRSARCQCKPDGQVIIQSTTQAPHSIKKQISKLFNIEIGKIVVQVPLVGGGFGGKATVQLEILAFLASQAVKGKKVKIVNSRREDMITSPCHLGMEGQVKLWATHDGIIKAAQMTFHVDAGAYADSGPKMTKAAAMDCSGPYNIENLRCDAICVYTNHPYTTAFRGFGHLSSTFALERTMDKLAFTLGMDPLVIRKKNALHPGHSNPTGVMMTASNLGDVEKCLAKVGELINWQEGQVIKVDDHKIRAKGLGCLMKTSSSPTNAVSGVVLICNEDGTINVNCGVVEYGHGTKTVAAQILAEKMQMDVSQIHVLMEVNTMASPDHWKTVASMSTFMLGRAIIEAADDIIRQIKSIGAIVFRCPPQDLEVAEGKVIYKADRSKFIPFKDLVHGYEYPEGHSIGSQIIGKGGYIMNHISNIDPETGQGKSGPYWTVGAQAVEVEFDKRTCSYRILKAATVLDAGKVLNPKNARGIVMGGMCMGLGYGSREHFVYDEGAKVINVGLRSYKMLRYGEQPEYLVDFVETPNEIGPYGSRGLAEHGILGIPAALANSIAAAAEVDITKTPITPETIWQSKMGGIL